MSVFDHQILAAWKIKNELGGSDILADEISSKKTVEAGVLVKEFLATELAKSIFVLAPVSSTPMVDL